MKIGSSNNIKEKASDNLKIELSHDILARAVYDKASAEIKMQRKVRDFVKNRYAYYLEQNEKGLKVLLSQDDINYISPHLAYIKRGGLEDTERKFIQDSKDAIRQKHEEEIAEAKRKQEEEIAAEKRKQEEIAAAEIKAQKEIAAQKLKAEKEIAEAKLKAEKEKTKAEQDKVKAEQDKVKAEKAKTKAEKEIADAKVKAEKEKTKRQRIIGFFIIGIAIGVIFYFWRTEQAALVNEQKMSTKNQRLERQMREIKLRDTTISKLSNALGIQRDSIDKYIIQIGEFNDSLRAERNRIDTLYKNLKNAHEHLKRLNSELALDNNYLIKDKGKLQKDKEILKEEKEKQKTEISKARSAIKRAESVTLSVQAQIAYSTNKPKEAYQLATAAWERNPKNKTACKILSNLARERLDNFSYPKGNYKMIIKKLGPLYGGKMSERQIQRRLN